MAEASSNLSRYDGVHYGYRSPAAVDLVSTYKRSRSEGFGKEVSGDDLDVPGADQDDDEETIGEEDEENNGYSLSKNDEEHDDLERDALD